jgi:hypothetical protein
VGQAVGCWLEPEEAATVASKTGVSPPSGHCQVRLRQMSRAVQYWQQQQVLLEWHYPADWLAGRWTYAPDDAADEDDAEAEAELPEAEAVAEAEVSGTGEGEGDGDGIG